MKKSRLFRASVLLLVISLMLSLANTTFSWFSRPESLTGKNLSLSDEYDTSVNNKTISFETYELNETTGEYSIPINGTTVGFSNSIGIAAGQRKCYRTDIYNSGTASQSVSLYLQSLTKGNNCSGISLGVNGPSKTYKKLNNGTTYNKVTNNSMRIYFQPKNLWSESSFVVNYDGTYKNMHYIAEMDGQRTYRCDIPSNTKKIYFAIENHDVNKPFQRSKEFEVSSTGMTPLESKVFYLEAGTTTDGYMNCRYDSVTGVNIAYYYRNIGLTVGNKFPAGLSKDSDYIGSKIEYFVDNNDTDIFSVDTNGEITANGVGTAKLYTKVSGGSYDNYDNNAYQVETEIVVTEEDGNIFYDVPVATNMLIEGATDAGNGVTSVYWYIKNDSTLNGMTYTIPEIYVTL